MHNIALQKLVHLYQLVDLDSFGNSKLPPKYAKEWEEQVSLPNHLYDKVKGAMRNPLYDEERDNVIITPTFMRGYLENLSKSVTQAQKFYIDVRGNNMLSYKEISAVLHDLDFYCPYPETFLQFETDDAVFQILALDLEELDENYKSNAVYSDTEKKIMDGKKITFMLNLYDKARKQFVLDGNCYTLEFRKDDVSSIQEGSHGYTDWVEDSEWKNLVDLSTDSDNQYSNQSLNTWVQYIDLYWTMFMIYLKYPQIAKPKSVNGRKPIWHHIPMRNFKNSAYREKPQYEHKELVISMYDNDYTGESNTTGRSGSTRFHSVRKHPRQLPNGKVTWVKAHFRGSKDEGVIFKDYKVPTS